MIDVIIDETLPVGQADQLAAMAEYNAKRSGLSVQEIRIIDIGQGDFGTVSIPLTETDRAFEATIRDHVILSTYGRGYLLYGVTPETLSDLSPNELEDGV